MDKDIERLGKERLGRQKKQRKWLLLTLMLAVIALGASIYSLIQPASATKSEGADISSYTSVSKSDVSYDKNTNTVKASIQASFELPMSIVMPTADSSVPNLNYYFNLPEDTTIDSSYLNTADYFVAYDDNDPTVVVFRYRYMSELDSDGNVTGYYIDIILDEAYYNSCVEKNASIIGGRFYIELCFASESLKDDGSLEVKFGDASVTFYPNEISYEDNKNIERDVEVYKEGGSLAFEGSNTYLEYKLTVTSNNGTVDNVDISDVLTYSGFEVSDVEIVSVTKNWNGYVDPDSYTCYVGPGVKADTYTLVASLQPLGAGESYYIVYRYKVDNIKEGNAEYASASNNVKVSSGTEGEWNYVSGTDSVDTDKISKVLISKNGTANESEGYIEWTITINKIKSDIAGYVLTDEAFAELVKDPTIVCSTSAGDSSYMINRDSDGRITGITFHEVSGAETNNNTYVITYKENVEGAYDGNTYTNTAIITSPGGSAQDATATVDVHSGELTKTAVSGEAYTDDQGEKNLTIDWQTNLDTPKSGIKSGTVYADELEVRWWGYKYQWYTYDQIKAIYQSLIGLFGSDTFDYYVYELDEHYQGGGTAVAYSNIRDTSKLFYKFEVRFTQDISYNEAGYTLQYQSTAAISDSDTNTSNGVWTFKNSTSIGDYTTSATYQYEKMVVKSDEGSTSNTYKRLDVGDTTSWTIRVSLLESVADGASFVRVKDALPDNLELVKLEFGASMDQLTEATILDGNISADGEVSVDGSYVDNEVNVRFKGDLYHLYDGYLYVKVTCRLTDDFFAEDTTVTVTNTAIVTFDDEDVYSSNSQTQVIKEPTVENVTESETVSKDYYYRSSTEAGLGRLNYAVTINPNQETLNEGNDLSLVDHLEYDSSLYDDANSTYSVDLIMESVKIYEADAAGELELDANGNVVKGILLDDNLWSYQYEEGYNIWWESCKYKDITVTVPDSKKLIMVYTYKINAQAGTTINSIIKNSVTLTGKQTYMDSENHNDNWKISDQYASGYSDNTYKFIKVEEGKFNKTLDGAVFTLFRYEDGAFVDTGFTYVTENGMFTVNFNRDNELGAGYQYGTAYYLVETAAPNGYQKPEEPAHYYFYFSDPDAADDTVVYDMPENFTSAEGEYRAVDITAASATAVVENKAVLHIRKEWRNAGSGDVLTPDASLQVKVQIYMTYGSVTEAFGEPVILSVDNDWGYTIEDLPTEYDGKNCTYYVEELSVTQNGVDITDRYETSYDNNEGISGGEITIINQEITEYRLPETGGSGRNSLYMLGAILVIFSAGFLLIYKNKKML